MMSFLEVCKPIRPANIAPVTQKELKVLVLLFKTKSGRVDKTLMKKYYDKLEVKFPAKLTNNIHHNQGSNLIYRLAVAIQDRPDKSITQRKCLHFDTKQNPLALIINSTLWS